MTEHALPIEVLLEKAEDYSKTTVELLRLNAIDKSADAVSSLSSGFVIFTVVCFFILMLSIGVAFWMSELLGRSYYGFFLVAGFYGLAGILIYAFRKVWIKNPVSNSMIAKLLNTKIA